MVSSSAWAAERNRINARELWASISSIGSSSASAVAQKGSSLAYKITRISLVPYERPNRMRHLLKVFRKVAQIFKSLQHDGYTLPIRISAAASDKLQLGRSKQKMFGEFLVKVGILKSRILPIHKLPRFPHQFGRGEYH